MSLMNMMYKAQKDAKNLIIQDQTNKANIDYNANLAAAQAPLPRILDNKGKIDSNIISTIAPPPTFQEYLTTAKRECLRVFLLTWLRFKKITML